MAKKNQKRTFRIRSNGKGDYPAADKIKSRISTVTRSMASTLLPRIGATNEERRKMVQLLYGIDSIEGQENKLNNLTCVYCGKPATGLDHLHPLIKGKKPTGYFTEPANLVPCCSSCNQRKSNTEWPDYMEKVEDDDNMQKERINNLKNFTEKMPATKLKLNDDLVNKYEELYSNIEQLLNEAQKELEEHADRLKKQL